KGYAMSIPIPTQLYHIGLHEARHAAYAAYVGFPIREISVSATAGHTDLTLPLDATSLQQRWDADPKGTRQHLIDIIGVICTPGYAEARGGFTGPCGDFEQLQRFGRAWSAVTRRTAASPAPPHGRS